MTELEEFRSKLENYRQLVTQRAIKFKETTEATNNLTALYKRFNQAEKSMADTVLAEWLLSNDQTTRFEAASLVRKFNIVSAAPALRELAERLSESSTPGDRDECEKMLSILEKMIF